MGRPLYDLVAVDTVKTTGFQPANPLPAKSLISMSVASVSFRASDATCFTKRKSVFVISPLSRFTSVNLTSHTAAVYGFNRAEEDRISTPISGTDIAPTTLVALGIRPDDQIYETDIWNGSHEEEVAHRSEFWFRGRKLSVNRQSIRVESNKATSLWNAGDGTVVHLDACLDRLLNGFYTNLRGATPARATRAEANPRQLLSLARTHFARRRTYGEPEFNDATIDRLAQSDFERWQQSEDASRIVNREQFKQLG